jgi:hypothetical protein
MVMGLSPQWFAPQARLFAICGRPQRFQEAVKRHVRRSRKLRLWIDL